MSDDLADTMVRFFEEDIQPEGMRDISDGEGFAWYLTHDLYTYDTVRMMLEHPPDCKTFGLWNREERLSENQKNTSHQKRLVFCCL